MSAPSDTDLYRLQKQNEDLRGQVQRWKAMAMRLEEQNTILCKRLKELSNEPENACTAWLDGDGEAIFSSD